MIPRRAAGPGAARALAFAAVLLLPACNRDAKPVFGQGGAASQQPDPVRVVTGHVALRREPGDAPRAQGDDAHARKTVVLATLHRGERVTLVEPGPEWSRVRTSGGAEGWVRSSSLLPAAEAQEATVLAACGVFDRPDLLAMNPRRKVEPGTLLLVRNGRDLFTEVDAGTGPTVWLLSDRLSTQPADVAAARLVDRARWLARNGRGAEALETLAQLRSTLPGSPLVEPLAVELGEAPAGATGATGPSGPGAP